MKTIFNYNVSCKDEAARVVEEVRKGMMSMQDRNLMIRIADSDGWVVAEKLNLIPVIESEEDRIGNNKREAG